MICSTPSAHTNPHAASKTGGNARFFFACSGKNRWFCNIIASTNCAFWVLLASLAPPGSLLGAFWAQAPKKGGKWSGLGSPGEAVGGSFWNLFYFFFYVWLACTVFSWFLTRPGVHPNLKNHDYSLKGHRFSKIQEIRKRGSRGLILPPFWRLFRHTFRYCIVFEAIFLKQQIRLIFCESWCQNCRFKGGWGPCLKRGY